MKNYVALVREAGGLVIEMGQKGVLFQWARCAEICRELDPIFEDLADHERDFYINIVSKREPK